jgi:hypothetical protein
VAFPVNVDPAAPASSGSPALGDDEFRQLKQQLLDLFTLPSATNITGPILSLGSLTDGKIATAPVVKAASPFHRLIGTEASAKDTRIIEDGGLLKVQENTGTEGTPVWTTRLSLTLSATGDLVLATANLQLDAGDLVWKSGTAFKGTLVHANTADRTYTFPDASGTVAFLDAGFSPGTRLIFDQDAAPTGWTRDATVDDRVVKIQGSGARVHGGAWIISGLSFAGNALAGHAHSMQGHTHSGTTAASITNTELGSSGAAVTADPHSHAFTTGGPSVGSTDSVSAGTPAGTVSQDGGWRPLHRSMILASKD